MNKKGKMTMTITIGVMCFLLTMVIFIQFKTISQTDIAQIETMREDELRTEIASVKTKCEEMLSQIEDTELKIQEYAKAINSEEEASKVLEKELEESRILLGKNEVSGEGIIVTLSDTRYSKIVASDLLALLNELKTAGAEAISINEQRIVYDSYVSDINNTYITVNGTRLVSPYIVKVIGNTKYLESGISQKQYGYIDTKLSEGKSITLEVSNNITIPKYNKNLEFEYVNN